MAKKQKIWLAVFLAMFLVPEILWFCGIRGNIGVPWVPIDGFSQLMGILTAYFTTLIPFIGLVGLLKTIKELQINKKFKIFLFIVIIPILCWLAFLTLMLIWVMIYYIDKAPQIG